MLRSQGIDLLRMHMNLSYLYTNCIATYPVYQQTRDNALPVRPARLRDIPAYEIVQD